MEVPGDYSGDHYYDKCIAEIRWLKEEACFYLHNLSDEQGIFWQDYYNFEKFKLIGNRHTNSELLGE